MTTDDNYLDLTKVSTSEVPAQRKAPAGAYLLRIQSYQQGKSDSGSEYYEVSFRIMDPLDGQDLKDTRRFVNQRFFFNKYGARDLNSLLYSVNPDWRGSDEKFPDMLEQIVGSNIIGTLSYTPKGDKEYANVKGFKAAA